MPRNNDPTHERKHLSDPCPPGYQLRQVKGQWCCVSVDGDIIAPNTKAPRKLVINPCPPGYELVHTEGRWMCRNADNGTTLPAERAKRNPRLSGGDDPGGGGSGQSDPTPPMDPM